jgi:uncharacterized protein (DUF2141 family)
MNKHLILAALAAAIAPAFAASVDASQGGLTVEVGAVRSASGNVVASLCKEGEPFPSGCKLKAQSKSENGTTKIDFPNLAPGKYAVAVFHDEDADGKLTFMKEGIGFSNGANLAFAQPKFESSAFAVNGKTTIKLNLKYFN